MTYPLSFVTKKGSNFGYENSHVLKGRVSIGDIFVRQSVFVLRDVVRTFYIFSFLFFLDTLFLLYDSKPCTHFDIYIERLLLHSFTYLFMCCFFSLFMHMLLINCMQSFYIFVSH